MTSIDPNTISALSAALGQVYADHMAKRDELVAPDEPEAGTWGFWAHHGDYLADVAISMLEGKGYYISDDERLWTYNVGEAFASLGN